jgi:hypothetical protein
MSVEWWVCEATQATASCSFVDGQGRLADAFAAWSKRTPVGGPAGLVWPRQPREDEMTGSKLKILIAAALTGLAGAAASAESAPVGSLCNAEGKIEVFGEVATITCSEAPEAEMKALLKAGSEYQTRYGLSTEKKMLIDARINRRVKELRKLKSAAKTAP